MPLLTALVFLPAVGALIIALLRQARPIATKAFALLIALLTFALSIFVAASFNTGEPGPQLAEYAPWIPALGIGYHLAVDGISLWLVVLTAFLSVIAVLAAWDRFGERTTAALSLLLLLETGLLGALLALDLVLFFVFWEAMLVPIYLILGLLGGERRTAAALKFFIYTAFGSLLMLVAIIALGLTHQASTGSLSFDISTLAARPVAAEAQVWLFLAFALAFAIKVPLVPFHTWLPDAYEQTPIPALVLSTMLVKVGAYGFIRFGLTLFPAAAVQFAPLLSTLAVISIIYGWLAAFGQRDLIRLIAYTSIAHMGYVVLGAFAFNAQGISGSVLQMVNHGITTGALFLVAMALVDRTGTSELGAFRGLGSHFPVLNALFLVALFSAVGLPGLNGFPSEFLTLLGAFRGGPAFALVALIGVVLAAVVLLWVGRLTLQGPYTPVPGGGTRHTDLGAREIGTLTPLVVLIVVLGMFPVILLSQMEASTAAIVSTVQKVRQAATQAWPQLTIDQGR